MTFFRSRSCDAGLRNVCAGLESVLDERQTQYPVHSFVFLVSREDEVGARGFDPGYYLHTEYYHSRQVTRHAAARQEAPLRAWKQLVRMWFVLIGGEIACAGCEDYEKASHLPRSSAREEEVDGFHVMPHQRTNK
jgi:hypothetical protein